MLKKIILTIAILSCFLCLTACSTEKKQLTCDGCGKTVEVSADSNMEENWIIFCEECGEPEILSDESANS